MESISARQRERRATLARKLEASILVASISPQSLLHCESIEKGVLAAHAERSPRTKNCDTLCQVFGTRHSLRNAGRFGRDAALHQKLPRRGTGLLRTLRKFRRSGFL